MKVQLTESQLTQLISEGISSWLNKAVGTNQIGAALQNFGNTVSTKANNLGNKIATNTKENAQIAAEKMIRNYISGAIRAISNLLQSSPNNASYKQALNYLQGANNSMNASMQANIGQKVAASQQRAHNDVAAQTQNANRMSKAKQQTANARAKASAAKQAAGDTLRQLKGAVGSIATQNYQNALAQQQQQPQQVAESKLVDMLAGAIMEQLNGKQTVNEGITDTVKDAASKAKKAVVKTAAKTAAKVKKVAKDVKDANNKATDAQKQQAGDLAQLSDKF